MHTNIMRNQPILSLEFAGFDLSGLLCYASFHKMMFHIGCHICGEMSHAHSLVANMTEIICLRPQV